MSSDDELTLAVVAHLQTLQDDPANAGDRAEQLEVATQCLSDAFEIDGTAAPEFTLAEVYQAGMKALTGDAEAMNDAFAKFIHDVSKKGFFEGCESSSPQFDERFQRAKKKFFDKYKLSASATPIPAPAPAAPPAGPSEEDKAAAQSAKGDGNNKLRAGDLDGALEAYSNAIELDPTCAVFYANRAAVYTKMAGKENLELAVADCQESVVLDPSYVKAYSRLGLAYYHLGNYEAAVNEGYSKAVELDPSNASAKKDLENAKKKLASANSGESTGGGAGAAPPTDPLAAMMAGLGGGGGGGMPDMSNLMGMMQNPAIQQMAQQMMGGGGGGVPDLSGLMSAMGGAGAGAGAGGGPTVEEEPANDSAAGADDGAELYDDDDNDDDDNDVSLAAQAAAEAQEATAAPAEDNPMAAMEEKIESNPRLKAIMEEVKTNPMAIMQHMNDPEVMSLLGDVMGGMMGGGGGAGGNPMAAMMAQMGGAAAAGGAPPDVEDMGEIN